MKKTPVGLVQQLALRVAGGQSVKGAAAAVGIPLRTARGLTRQDAYRAELAEAQKEIRDRVVNLVASGSTAAVVRLIRIVGEPDVESALRAAKILTDCFAPTQTLSQIVSRMEAIESHDLAQRDPSPTVEG